MSETGNDGNRNKALTGRPGHNAGAKFPAEPLTRAEVEKLMAALNHGTTGARNRAAVALMYRSGLRVSEALALRPSDVDLDGGSVRVLHGKGDKARTVGMDSGTAALVGRWLDARRKLGLRNGHLLCQLDGSALSAQAVREMLKRAAAKAGLEKRVHPHGLRHSHAAELVAEGVPTDVIRDQLGHASLAVTDRYLRSVAPAAVVNAIRRRQWTP